MVSAVPICSVCSDDLPFLNAVHSRPLHYNGSEGERGRATSHRICASFDCPHASLPVDQSLLYGWGVFKKNQLSSLEQRMVFGRLLLPPFSEVALFRKKTTLLKSGSAPEWAPFILSDVYHETIDSHE